MSGTHPRSAIDRVLAGTHILLSPYDGSDVLAAALVEAGADVALRDPSHAETVRELVTGAFDAVLLPSATDVEGWWATLHVLPVAEALADLAASGRLHVQAVGPATDPSDASLAKVVLDVAGSARAIQTSAGVLRLRAAAATLDHEVLP